MREIKQDSYFRRLANRIASKLGYIPRNGFANTLVELAIESSRRQGTLLEYDFGWSRVKIAMKDIYNL